MQPNIFRIADRIELGAEDALTAYWHYVLTVVPGMGQAFVDEIASLSGTRMSPFIGAIDHPAGDRSSHPDLLIQCRDRCLLFEHKLNSGLGVRQLHRYLELARSRKWQLALLSADLVAVDEEILRSSMYVRPRAGTRAPHFLWQDVHRIVGRSDHHLAREFHAYLGDLGLGQLTWAGQGNPFIDQNASQAVVSLYDSVRPIFEGTGASCRKSANSLIYQVRRPFPLVHLINLAPLISVAQRVPELRGPVMSLWVWMRRSKPDTRLLPREDKIIRAAGLRIFVSNEESGPLPYDRQLVAERSYEAVLDEVLRPTVEESRRRLVAFVRAAVGHLRSDLESVQTRHRPGHHGG